MNKIRLPTDLAINGAAPAYTEPLHVGRPNIGDQDVFIHHVKQILDRRWLSNNGPMVQELEQRLADYLGVKHCVVMVNGTLALEIAIRALGLEGEVIVPSWTFVATAHTLYWQGITPVFADIDPATHNLDPQSVRRMITSRTSGILAVHLWGRAAPVRELQEIADEHGLKLMFDAAHAFGSTYQGRSIGHFGACEIFSFHATKAYNSMEGGAITTEDDVLAESLRQMRNFGFKGYDNVLHEGINGKMTEVCAAMGLVNLDSFDGIVKKNRQNYLAYVEALAGLPGLRVLEYDPAEHNSHHYVVLEVDDASPVSRDELIATLHAENILARKYFWPGCHRMQPYRDLDPQAGDRLPHTTRLAEQVIVLPSGTAMTGRDIRIVTDVLRARMKSSNA